MILQTLRLQKKLYWKDKKTKTFVSKMQNHGKKINPCFNSSFFSDLNQLKMKRENWFGKIAEPEI